MENEIYTSEEKVLNRFGITSPQAIEILLAAGYRSTGEARDALGRQLGFHVALLKLVNELKTSLAEARAEVEALKPKPKKADTDAKASG